MSQQSGADGVRIAGRRFDVTTGKLTTPGADGTHLSQEAAAVLELMAADPENTVPLDRVASRIGRDAGLDDVESVVSEIRRALGPQGHAALRTVGEKGYALYPDPSATTAPDRTFKMVVHSIAILSFVVVSGLGYCQLQAESGARAQVAPVESPLN
ncbi:MAG: helix-turn-helix domain-containing protein [Celeribacter sp.]|jgi:DNA-binding winged helix-turn-helix (wHTH) protein